MSYKIAVIKGDGIGPEVVEAGMEILDAIGERYGHQFIFNEVMAGGVAYDKYGVPLPEETIKVCKESDAVLLGAVGGPEWDNLAVDKRPEQAILGLRKEMGLFANIRPGTLFKALEEASPLKAEIIKDGFDIVIVRELIGGIYFGESGIEETDRGKMAYDIERYSEREVERISRVAFEMAIKRNKRLTSVDKSNVLESSRLWRRVVTEISKEYPEVELNHIYIDNAAMQVIRDPKQFDVILTSNLFGDILSDEVSMLTGSIGMLPSASLGEGSIGLYEPIHGSAPEIKGQNRSNPIATILSIAMMLRYSLELNDEADCIERSVNRILDSGYRTIDIAVSKEDSISTREMAQAIKRDIIGGK